jgi:hypothetical protein
MFNPRETAANKNYLRNGVTKKANSISNLFIFHFSRISCL